MKSIPVMKSLQKPAVLLAAMPKSASNTLLARLEHAIDCRVIKPKSGGGMGHLTINPAGLAPAWKTVFTGTTPLVYQHFLPLEWNRHVVLSHLNVAARPKIIVSVRNIYDAMLSAERHQWAGYGPFWIERMENNYFAKDGAAASHALIWNGIMFTKFYAAWASAHAAGTWDVKFVTYDQIVNAPRACVEDALGFFGLTPNLDAPALDQIGAVQANISPDSNKAELPARYKQMIQDFAGSFTGLDFSPIGL